VSSVRRLITYTQLMAMQCSPRTSEAPSPSLETRRQRLANGHKRPTAAVEVNVERIHVFNRLARTALRVYFDTVSQHPTEDELHALLPRIQQLDPGVVTASLKQAFVQRRNYVRNTSVRNASAREAVRVQSWAALADDAQANDTTAADD
jgi:hypothetical protein